MFLNFSMCLPPRFTAKTLRDGLRSVESVYLPLFDLQHGWLDEKLLSV